MYNQLPIMVSYPLELFRASDWQLGWVVDTQKHECFNLRCTEAWCEVIHRKAKLLFANEIHVICKYAGMDFVGHAR